MVNHLVNVIYLGNEYCDSRDQDGVMGGKRKPGFLRFSIDQEPKVNAPRSVRFL